MGLDTERGSDGAGGAGASGRGAGFDYARAWRVAAFALLAAAAVPLYLGRRDMAFFVAVLGVSAWFLNVRTAIKRKHDMVRDGGRNWRPRADVEARRAKEPEEE